MNKSVLGFLVGIVLIAVMVIGFLMVTQEGEEAPAPTAQTTAPSVAATQPPQRVDRTPAATPTPLDGVTLSMERSLGGDGSYSPGGTVDVTITLNAEGAGEPVRAMGIEESIPAGFTYDGVVSDKRPDLAPPAGRSNRVEFAWFNIPDFPSSFTYRLRANADASGTANITGQTLYRTSGPELRTEVLTTPLTPAGEATAAAATPAAATTPEVTTTPEINAAPTPAPQPSIPASVSQLAEGQLSMTRSAGGYTPGAPVEVTVSLDFEGDAEVSTLAMLETLPPGWTFASVSGEGAPTIKPQEGKEGNLAFIWMTPPTLPVSFSYTVNAPGDAEGTVRLSGTGVWSTGGLERNTDAVITELSPE